MLADFQPDVLKIDMALTRSVHADEVRSKIIAEGIESIEEAVALRAMGVPFFQGYLFARPAIEQLPRVPASIIDSVQAVCESMLLGEPAEVPLRRAMTQ